MRGSQSFGSALVVAGACFILFGLLGLLGFLIEPEGTTGEIAGGLILIAVTMAIGAMLVRSGLRRRRQAKERISAAPAPAMAGATAPAAAVAGPPASLFELDTLVCTRRAPGARDALKELFGDSRTTHHVALFQDLDGGIAAYAPLPIHLNALEGGRRMAEQGVDLLSAAGEKLLNLRSRERMVLRTQTLDVFAPDGTHLAYFTHNTMPFVRDLWRVFEPAGRQIGEAGEKAGLKALIRMIPILGALFTDQEYRVVIRERHVATALQVSVGLHVTMHRTVADPVDLRLVLAFCALRTLLGG